MPDERLPMVSVAVITYNQVQYIGATLESAVRQDYPNLEVVVADDGSSDGTREVVLEYATRYPGRVVPALADANTGITANSNRALAACSGEFVAILGGDDLFYPGKITAQVRLMREHPDCNLSFHPVRIFDSETDRTLGFMGDGPNQNTVEDIVRGNFLPASSVMIRRPAHPTLIFDARVPVASDWLFFIQAAIGGPVLRLSKVYGAYRRHGGNVTSRSLLGDAMSTLDIVEATMPEMHHAVRVGRAHMLYGEAVRLIDLGQVGEARPHLRAALRIRPRNGRLWRWYLTSYLGASRLRWVHGMWMRHVAVRRTASQQGVDW